MFFVPLCAYLFSSTWNTFPCLCLVNLTLCSRCYKRSTHTLLAPTSLVHASQTSNCQHLKNFCLRVFWSCWCLLCIHIHTWQARSARKLMLSGDALNQCWWEMIMSLYSCPLDTVVLRHGLHCFPASTRRIKFHLPTIVNLLDNSFLLMSFLSWSHFFTPLLVFPVVITYHNYLTTNPCLRVGF